MLQLLKFFSTKGSSFFKTGLKVILSDNYTLGSDFFKVKQLFYD